MTSCHAAAPEFFSAAVTGARRFYLDLQTRAGILMNICKHQTKNDMTTNKRLLKNWFLMPGYAVLVLASVVCAQDKTNSSVQAQSDASEQSAKAFNDLADKALLAMKQRAEELKIKGEAVVAFVPGDDTKSWCSKMLVVGHLKTDSSTNSVGQNLLAIAYSKASEMADTLKPSGSGVRKPLKGEFGYQGGWIVEGKTGHIIAAFSGGRSEEDVQVSKTGVEALTGSL